LFGEAAETEVQLYQTAERRSIKAVDRRNDDDSETVATSWSDKTSRTNHHQSNDDGQGELVV
jgi:hypothetical protein